MSAPSAPAFLRTGLRCLRACLRCGLHAAGLAVVLAALLATLAQAQDETAARRPLPEPVAAALRAASIPLSASAIAVLPLAPGGVTIEANATQPMNPASTMKLVTTYAALGLLGPAYTWRTEAFATGALRGDVLDGDLVVRGSGDPKLVIESLWLMIQRIRGYGIREIRGEVVLDRSAFAPLAHDPAEFDGERFRPYNTGPDALLLNFKAVAIGFVPDPETRSARVVALPPLAGMKLPPAVRAVDGACGDWRARLQADFADPMAPVFRGAYPLSCGERIWHLSVLDHPRYFAAAFAALWSGSGGTWSGKLREGPVPAEARRIAMHESAPLAEVIRDVNKFSNNVMARQIFLTLGAEASRQPANAARAEAAIRQWLDSRGLAMPELVLENGSGLSRSERISAASLARLLRHAFASPLMPELMASLPLVGVDGTMRKRNGAAGNAHIKTGLLADVRAIAGYVHAASGRRYAVAAIINHPNARDAQAAHDALLQWLYQNG
jgi:D-alanyl-D-alanine carboxypeptidase/D-alanyl-D-alanine-endopeptidase (penicillin-binding protein 4)